MYKVYLKTWSSVYEPAEGGYYVPVSKVEWYEDVESIAEARQLVKVFAEEEPTSDVEEYWMVHYQYATLDNDGVVQLDSDGDIITGTALAPYFAEVDRNTGYIGEGWDFIVVVDGDPAPCPDVYNGYR